MKHQSQLLSGQLSAVQTINLTSYYTGKSNMSDAKGHSALDAVDYTISFPNDPVDYDDGMCWLECRLRDAQDDELLVVMGWTLQKREEDGAWLIHNIDWQDFRDKFRPGIGREEWERICG
mmetsp:Transcript_20641/g.29943  ORF Transcript_20641/g.29943 Transcript_20641/m.29943 type:complete len:120 (-) Transcript_20641:339-698(-)